MPGNNSKKQGKRSADTGNDDEFRTVREIRAQHHAMLNLTKAIAAENNMGGGSESVTGDVAIY